MNDETPAVRRARETAEAGFTLIGAILAGRASEDDAEDWTEAWHSNPHLHDGRSLEDVFGMSWTEYSRWVHDPDVVREIVAERRRENGS